MTNVLDKKIYLSSTQTVLNTADNVIEDLKGNPVNSIYMMEKKWYDLLDNYDAETMAILFDSIDGTDFYEWKESLTESSTAPVAN